MNDCSFEHILHHQNGWCCYQKLVYNSKQFPWHPDFSDLLTPTWSRDKTNHCSVSCHQSHLSAGYLTEFSVIFQWICWPKTIIGLEHCQSSTIQGLKLNQFSPQIHSNPRMGLQINMKNTSYKNPPYQFWIIKILATTLSISWCSQRMCGIYWMQQLN